MSRAGQTLTEAIAKLRDDACVMVETSRLEEASLRCFLEAATTKGQGLVKTLGLTEAARDEALAGNRGASERRGSAS